MGNKARMTDKEPTTTNKTAKEGKTYRNPAERESVCVCVCVREREREREGGQEN